METDYLSKLIIKFDLHWIYDGRVQFLFENAAFYLKIGLGLVLILIKPIPNQMCPQLAGTNSLLDIRMMVILTSP